MATVPQRIIIDTNTLLRGVISERSVAGTVVREAQDRRLLPLLSKPVLDEYRAVLSRPVLIERFPALTTKRIAYLIQRLRYVGEYIRRPKARFEYARDPLDEKFVELAIDLNADYIITADNDLLSLPGGKDDTSRRFRQRLPHVAVLEAADFLAMQAPWR